MKNTFEIAKNEFKNENSEGKTRLVYAYFGLAIYFAQCLEKTFQIMIGIDKIIGKKVNSNVEIKKLLDEIENSRMTMGKLIDYVEKAYNLDQIIVECLKNLLNIRNNLAHNYFKLNSTKFFSDDGKLEMILYFCDFVDKSEELIKKLEECYKIHQYRLGITEEKINEMIKQMEEQELERVKEKYR